jgi:hypothetical protein
MIFKNANMETVEARVTRSRSGSRSAPLFVRAWTGRSALSSATSTPRPYIATAGERLTRVGAMRLSGPITISELRYPGPARAMRG